MGNVKYANLIELIFSFLMVFILSQSDTYLKNYGILKLYGIKSKILV